MAPVSLKIVVGDDVRMLKFERSEFKGLTRESFLAEVAKKYGAAAAAWNGTDAEFKYADAEGDSVTVGDADDFGTWHKAVLAFVAAVHASKDPEAVRFATAAAQESCGKPLRVTMCLKGKKCFEVEKKKKTEEKAGESAEPLEEKEHKWQGWLTGKKMQKFKQLPPPMKAKFVYLVLADDPRVGEILALWKEKNLFISKGMKGGKGKGTKGKGSKGDSVWSTFSLAGDLGNHWSVPNQKWFAGYEEPDSTWASRAFPFFPDDSEHHYSYPVQEALTEEVEENLLTAFQSYKGKGKGMCKGMMTKGKGQKSGENGGKMKCWARFLQDVTVKSGESMAGGSYFVKTWRVRNDSQFPWPSNVCIMCAQGHSMDAEGDNIPKFYPLAGLTCAPGEEVEVSVPLRAPVESGTYTGWWRLCSNGFPGRGFKKFGMLLECKINVLSICASTSGSQASSGLPPTSEHVTVDKDKDKEIPSDFDYVDVDAD